LFAPLFLKAQYRTPKNHTEFSLWVPKIKGHVKSVKVIDSNLKEVTTEKLFNHRNSANKTYTTIYNYNRNGDIDTILYFNDSLKTISHQKVFIYDTLNNLIQVYSINKNGKKRIEEGYGYDSLGRWVETKHYDSTNKYVGSEFKEYKSNDSLVYYNVVGEKSEKCKSVEIYKKNMITTISYFSNNKDIYYKSTEIVDGDIKSMKAKRFNQDNRNIFVTEESYINLKNGYWETIAFNSDGSVYSYQKIKYKYNKFNDLIESINFQKIKKSNSENSIEKIKLTYKYVYDTHGNFVNKIGQNSDKTTFETIRTIEYYD